jgi:16S rRNA (cytosine1402-N4)-methyltransferase
VNSLSEKELADLFFLFGEEKNARKIARRIVSEREKIPFATTSALAEVVRSCVPERWQIKSLSRIFQAIRIAVNGEMDELSEGLTKVYPYLKSDAHVVVIMYHGLESRIVKRYFRGEALSFRRSNQAFGERQYRFRNLTSKGIQASEEEIRQNPRARSAVLRAGEKLAE